MSYFSIITGGILGILGIGMFFMTPEFASKIHMTKTWMNILALIFVLMACWFIIAFYSEIMSTRVLSSLKSTQQTTVANQKPVVTTVTTPVATTIPDNTTTTTA